jgi:hypothetical protein
MCIKHAGNRDNSWYILYERISKQTHHLVNANEGLFVYFPRILSGRIVEGLLFFGQPFFSLV